MEYKPWLRDSSLTWQVHVNHPSPDFPQIAYISKQQLSIEDRTKSLERSCILRRVS